MSEPLRTLTRKDVPYQWGKEQDKAFNELNKRLANTETLGYFDLDAETRLMTDASPENLVAVLTQVQIGEEQVICYASRRLTDVERRYSQTEREALGIVWACERLHTYLCGTDFEILTDHKQAPGIYLLKEITPKCKGQSVGVTIAARPFDCETHPRKRKHCRYFISSHRSADQIMRETVHRNRRVGEVCR